MLHNNIYRKRRTTFMCTCSLLQYTRNCISHYHNVRIGCTFLIVRIYRNVYSLLYVTLLLSSAGSSHKYTFHYFLFLSKQIKYLSLIGTIIKSFLNRSTCLVHVFTLECLRCCGLNNEITHLFHHIYLRHQHFAN